MGNFLCGRYVLLNADPATNNENSNASSDADAAALVSDGGGDARMSLLEISRRIQRQMLAIQGKFMTPINSEAGTLVDYAGVKGSADFAEYLRTARLLAKAPLATLEDDDDERRAFFINVYNALNVHGIVARGGLPQSLTGKLGYWKRTGYIIDGMRFTLDDIEHGILRGNSRASSQLTGTTYFHADDPRLRYSLKKDARIHFALNCGARSCPAIRVYDGENLDMGLNGATRAFCASEVSVNEGDDAVAVEISHLFKWFRGDFIPKDDHKEDHEDDPKDATSLDGDPVLRWIVQATEGASSVGTVDKLRSALESRKQICITYKPYDWTANER